MLGATRKNLNIVIGLKEGLKIKLRRSKTIFLDFKNFLSQNRLTLGATNETVNMVKVQKNDGFCKLLEYYV